MDGPALAFDLLRVGHCTHPECVAMRGGSRNSIEFPALAGLIHHPQRGYVLYDTGYSKHFFDATKAFPECLYRLVTPPKLPVEEELIHQLESRNLSADQIGTIVISHFHGDHVAGLRDFPKARFIATKDEYCEVRRKGRLARLRNAFLADLIPEDFDERVSYAEDMSSCEPGLLGFAAGYDLFGDGSMIGVPLPGHTASHLGVVLRDHLDRRILMIGDACWKMEALAERRLPSRIAAFLFADNSRFEETFWKLADLHEADPALTIIPSHCQSTWRRLGNSRQVGS